MRIRPGRKAGDQTVHELRGLEYESNGQVPYKLSFSENSMWEILRHMVQVPTEPLEWIRMFSNTPPIKQINFHDLKSMKRVVPVERHPFYDNLPQEETALFDSRNYRNETLLLEIVLTKG